MTKILVAALLSAFAVVSFAQGTATASAPVKKHHHHHHGKKASHAHSMPSGATGAK